MKNTPLGLVAIAPSPSQPKKQSQQRPNVWRWWLLMVWGLLPLFSQAQCVTSFGSGSIVSTSAMTNKVLVVMRTSVVLTGAAATCTISPTELMSTNTSTPVTQFGVTVDFTKVKFRNQALPPEGCRVDGNGTLNFAYVCQIGNAASGKTVSFDVEYLLEGKSTTTSDALLFRPSLTAYTNLSNANTFAASTVDQYAQINVPKSTAPTCSTAINPTAVNLGNIRPTDLAGAVGSFTTLGQKTFSLSMTCLANALSKSTTFTPSFKFTQLLAVTGASGFDIALSNDADPGFGFRILDPQGTAIKSEAALANATFAFNTPGSIQSISHNFTAQYAKTKATLNPGVVSATIAITISFP